MEIKYEGKKGGRDEPEEGDDEAEASEQAFGELCDAMGWKRPADMAKALDKFKTLMYLCGDEGLS